MSAVLPRARRTPRSRQSETLPKSSIHFTGLHWDRLAMTIHDIRAPVAVISATTELLKVNLEQRGSEEDAILLQRIQRSTSWLITLVDNLAVETELSASPLSLDWSTVDLRECTEESLAIAQTLFDQRQQRVRWPRECAVKVSGDRRRIQQVLINLLTNASKYGDSHSEIRIDIVPCGEWARIQIHNYGPTIPAWEQGQIFERFVRGSNAKSAGGAGLGLGLHIVKKIVERHGGQVGVISSPEQGTVLWFTLPAAH